MGWDISLSASKLSLLRECRRCFYDANVLKIERPRGIFPSLPGGVDRVMKEQADLYRWGMLPALSIELHGQLWGDVEQINKLRNWRSGLKALLRIGGKTVSLIGALDDLIVEEDGELNRRYSPFDTKTKGDEPNDDGSQYYQGQMDVYALLLRENHMMPSGNAYLCYWYPVSLTGQAMTWQHKLFTLTAEADRAIATLEGAVGVLTGKQPDPDPACEFCRFAQARVDAALAVVAK